MAPPFPSVTPNPAPLSRALQSTFAQSLHREAGVSIPARSLPQALGRAPRPDPLG